MGADCLSGSKSSRQIAKKPQKTIEPMKENRQQKYGLQNLSFQSPQRKMSQHSPTAIWASGIAKGANNYQKSNPEEILLSLPEKSNIFESQQQQDIWNQIQNTRSSIIRLPSKLGKSSSKQSSPNKAKEVIEDFENCQMFQAELKTQRFQERITISNEDLDIQFLLPRGRAGPIVAPYINYDDYFIDQSEQ